MSYLPLAKFHFSGHNPYNFCDFFMKNFISILTDISRSYLCSILTLSHVGQELWLDLQTDHVSKTGLDVHGRIEIRELLNGVWQNNATIQMNLSYLHKCIVKLSWIYNTKFKTYGPWNYVLLRANNSWTNKTGIVILVPTYWLDTIHLCMKFHEFISSCSIVMAPDLKTRPRTHGRGDDSARAVVNRPPFIESFTLQLSRKGPLAFIFR